MIIIKIIILYFIQIRHPDDFPSTGTRLVLIIYILSNLHCHDYVVFIHHTFFVNNVLLSRPNVLHISILIIFSIDFN